MIKTIKQACRFNPVIQDYRMSQGIENLADLIDDAGDGREFFSRNFVTHGMEQLFREGLLRLSGKSDQAVFELTQAMGGGKTHMMIALGLLARHPHLRPEVLSEDLSSRADFGMARIAAFNGRNNPENYIWGEIATQLGEAEAIKPFWVNGPKAVDQRKWKEIIGDKPTLILLDELPPYLDNASTQVFGQGTLANMVVYSLSSLMSAALELPNCAIVVANLSGSYKAQTKALGDAISNLQQETRRQAMTITPVQLSGNEIYEILKKRLIDELPDERVIADVADEYAQQIKKAEDGGYIVAASLEQIAEQVRETYPFHPSFKHLVALFKENEGFRQTRGLMQFTARLLKSVAERESDDVFLIGTQHLALNDDQVKDEIERIAPKLMPALTRDIADNGNAIAETIDDELDGDAAQQVMTLLLASSLSRAVGGRIGLSDSEIIEFLSAPNRKADEFLQALQRLREQAWYLHREDQRFFVKETENLSRQIERNAKEVPQPKIDQALINRLNGILQPERRNAYQDVQVLPKLDELKLTGPRTLIVIKPDGKVPPSELQNFFDYQQEKNNLLVLTGQDSHMADAVEDRLRELYAIEQIHKRLKPGDTLFEEARDRMEEAEDRFEKALSAAYNRVYFPSVDDIDGREFLAPVTIDNGLKLGNGDQSAEAQLESLLGSPRANYKLASDLSENFNEYFAMAEEYLWPSGMDNRRTPWKDVVSRAKGNPVWPWMPGSGGMDTLKSEALKQGRWRLGEDGYVEKGPFPKDKTTVNVSVIGNHPETGETILGLTPRHAGESPLVLYATKAEGLDSGKAVDDLDNFATGEGTLYFLVKDQTGQYETGAPVRWTADLKIRHQVDPSADKRRITLACTPNADLFYTLDGSNPKDGAPYEGPFELGPQAVRLLVYARSGEANKTADFQIAASGDKTVKIIDAKPAKLQSKRVALDTTDRVFGVINHFRDQPGTRFKGVRIEIGEGENTVTVRFQEREVTAAMIETVVNKDAGSPNELLAFMREIAARSDHVLLGTATPIQTKPEDLWDLMGILQQGKGNFVLGSDFAPWHRPNEVLPILSGEEEVPDAGYAWQLLRSPLPLVDSTQEQHARKLFSAIRQDLALVHGESQTNKKVSELTEDTREILEDELDRRISGATFFQRENPLVRHTVLRKRVSLEEAGLLTKVGVDVHPNRQLVTDPRWFDALFEAKALRTNENFREAYREARLFGKALGKRGKGGGFMKNLMEQRICSSIHAGLSTARMLLEGRSVQQEEDEQEVDLKVESDEEHQVLTRLISRLENIDEDPKLNAVIHYLEKEKWWELGVIIFSQYFETAKWVADELASRYPDEAIGLYAGAGRSRLYQRGDSVTCERETLKKMVAEHEIRIMVATDAACEGLNLQTLGTLINIDLPWNPTRLEQRIGRIKRFGQKRETVDMLNLVNEQTVDEKIYDRLSERMRNRYDLFGSVPDTIKDEWIDDIETLGEKMDEFINAQKEATGFDLRYTGTMEPPEKDWRDCSKVLSRRDFAVLMSAAWS